MPRDKKNEGDLGEAIAIQFLRNNNYRVIEKNFRIRNGEIDVIAIDTSEYPHTLCFIEVKTRKTTAFGKPFEAIGYYKIQAMVRTAEFYKATHKNLPDGMRLDAISIELHTDSSVKDIQLVKNIA
jgi:putative endonuclease